MKPERLQEIKYYDLEGGDEILFTFLDELIAAVEQAQAELADEQRNGDDLVVQRNMQADVAADLRKQLAEAQDDAKHYATQYNNTIGKLSEAQAELTQMQDWINANPNRKRAYELDSRSYDDN